MKLKPCILAATLGMTAAWAGAQAPANPADAQRGVPLGAGTVVSAQPDPTEAMQKLSQAAQRLRESIQALAQKPAGSERDRGIMQAQEALLETQRAMLQLPPEMRSQGAASTATYDESVQKMVKASEALRASIEAMNKAPAGEGRNQAIRQANEALLETHAAMALAYVPDTGNAPPLTQAGTLGAGAAAGAGAGAVADKPQPLGGPVVQDEPKK